MCTNTLRVNYYHFCSSLTVEGSWAWRDGVTCPKLYIKEGAKQWLGPQRSQRQPGELNHQACPLLHQLQVRCQTVLRKCCPWSSIQTEKQIFTNKWQSKRSRIRAHSHSAIQPVPLMSETTASEGHSEDRNCARAVGRDRAAIYLLWGLGKSCTPASPTFLVPGTSFMEDHLSLERGQGIVSRWCKHSRVPTPMRMWCHRWSDRRWSWGGNMSNGEQLQI